MGLLFTVVITTVAKARDKANTSTVKAQLTQLRTEASLLSQDNLLGSTPASGASPTGNFGSTPGVGVPMSCFTSEGGPLRPEYASSLFGNEKMLTIMRQVEKYNGSEVLMCAIGNNTSNNAVVRWRLLSVLCINCYDQSVIYTSTPKSVCMDSAGAFKNGMTKMFADDILCI